MLLGGLILWSTQLVHAEEKQAKYPFTRTLEECSKHTGIIDNDVLNCLKGLAAPPSINSATAQNPTIWKCNTATGTVYTGKACQTENDKASNPTLESMNKGWQQLGENQAKPIIETNAQHKESSPAVILFGLVSFVGLAAALKHQTCQRQQKTQPEKLKTAQRKAHAEQDSNDIPHQLPLSTNYVDALSLQDPLNDQSIIVQPAWTKTLIQKLEWKRFEDLCVEYYRALGHQAETTSLGADAGVDFTIYNEEKDNLLFLGQCKAWNAYKVGVKPIREFYGVMKSRQMNHGIYITSGMYTQEAISFAGSLPSQDEITLIDGDNLFNLITTLPEDKQHALFEFATEGDYTTPTCPRCGKKMIRREAKKGKNAGDEFWGCVNYPRCKYTLHGMQGTTTDNTIPEAGQSARRLKNAERN